MSGQPQAPQAASSPAGQPLPAPSQSAHPNIPPAAPHKAEAKDGPPPSKKVKLAPVLSFPTRMHQDGLAHTRPLNLNVTSVNVNVNAADILSTLLEMYDTSVAEFTLTATHELVAFAPTARVITEWLFKLAIITRGKHMSKPNNSNPAAAWNPGYRNARIPDDWPVPAFALAYLSRIGSFIPRGFEWNDTFVPVLTLPAVGGAGPPGWIQAPNPLPAGVLTGPLNRVVNYAAYMALTPVSMTKSHKLENIGGTSFWLTRRTPGNWPFDSMEARSRFPIGNEDDVDKLFALSVGPAPLSVHFRYSRNVPLAVANAVAGLATPLTQANLNALASLIRDCCAYSLIRNVSEFELRNMIRSYVMNVKRFKHPSLMLDPPPHHVCRIAHSFQSQTH